jgi:cellulose synthase/poly-beta-1,6-N-acetylglucosamine synthase-like glycosyltransferase
MSVIPQDILDTEYLGQEKEVNKIEPLVSVVTTTYNQEKYIGECLDSILMQKTNFPVELIIGEDGSSDLTREICMEYADRNPDKIRLFLRTPKQKMEVRGRKTFHYNFFNSIKNSRGRYCAICEGDDFWTDVNKLQYQVDFLERNEQFSLHYHQCEVVNEGMTNKRSYQSVQEPKSF